MRVAAASFLASSLVGSALAQTATVAVATDVPAGIETSAPYTEAPFWRQIAPANQSCGPDIIVDDFKTTNFAMLPLQGETAPRWLNLLGGDYGEPQTTPAGFNFTFSTTGNYVELIPQSNNTFWFFKLDPGACFDLSGINALAFDIIAPAGATFDIGMTQKSPSCDYRIGGETGLGDSAYKPLSKYAVADGTKHTAVVPFQDFKGFDFSHLKDITLINWAPVNAVFRMSNIRLIRECNGNGPWSTTNSTVSYVANDIAPLGASATSAVPSASVSVPVPASTPAVSAATDSPAATGATAGSGSSASTTVKSSAAGAVAPVALAVGALFAGVLALL
ncbi:hypothetical protein HKX48_004064 [Thoreauomyces humboldtii]|nr:hypothetical protein HKX48_004064 [Thoreauomyces humboldtii]